ncbi:hypothetical protein ACINK0_02605 [Deinococcus sp. VB343]|uniref:hypothetical protein n=1 Tax=Deinococcus sp. VB343 TaxID=3385567 RepID=UPI0039C8CAD4
MPWFIRNELIIEALSALRSRKVHPLFAGYLHLQQRCGELGRLTDLEPEFLSYFKQFYYIPGHPFGTPYIRIFTDKSASATNLWLNSNVAGSYAPSSLRPNQPFRRVVKIEDKRYSLYDDHSKLSLEHLMYGSKLDASELALFLYRDYCFDIDRISIDVLLDVFCYEFGYSKVMGGERSQDYFNLFSDVGEDSRLRNRLEGAFYEKSS